MPRVYKRLFVLIALLALGAVSCMKSESPERKEYDAAMKRAEKAYNQDDWARAVKLYTEAIELAPEDSDPYIQRGLSHFYNKDNARAIKDFSKAIELDPKRSFAYEVRGDAHMAAGDKKSADKDFDKAEELRNQN